MRDKRISNREIALVDFQDLVNAPARRVGFQSQDTIGGTLLQAKTAVNTAGIEIPRGTIAGSEVRLSFCARRLYRGLQNRNLPRLSICFASSACFTARIATRSVGVVPHMSTCAFSAVGQC